MKQHTKEEVRQMNANSIRESLAEELSAVLAKYLIMENTEANRIKMRAEIAQTIYSGGAG